MSRLLSSFAALLVGALTAFVPASARAQSGCTTYPALCGLAVHSTIEQADLDAAIDVVLVGDGYTTADQAKWASDAASAINSFKTASTGLYGRAPNLFNFHVVDVVSASNAVTNADLTDTALGMNVSGAFITANAAKVNLAALNAPDVDQVVAIANAGSGRANADYPSQLASGSTARLHAGGLAVITHELGHGLFHLADEYEEAGICASWPAPSESSMLAEPNVTAEATCYKFQGIAGAGCIQGARYCSTGAWRSASTCFMRTNNGAACPVCMAHVDRVLLERRTQSDRGAPWVVAAVPGSPVAGTVQLSALVFDDWFVPHTLVFEVDGATVGSVSTAGGSSQLPFDTTRLADGVHSLVVYATDAAGYSSASKAVTFSTLNFTDATAPAVSIVSPANGASLSGMAYVSVSVSGSAADVQQIVLSIDGTPTAVSLGSAWLSYPWDLSAVAAGTHTLDAQAVDSSQNVGNAATVTVTTSPGSTPGRGPTIYKPADGSAVGPAFTLEWSAGESGVQGGGGSSVELLVDAVEVSPNPLAGKTNSALIDASLWALGPHQLRLRSKGVLGDPVFVVRVAPTAPAAFIASPRPYEVVRGTVSVSLLGTDDAAISSVELFADGALAGSVSAGSGTVAWSTLGKPKQVVLEAVAHSSDGGQARSAKTQVRVDNSAPVVAVTRPAQGATVPPGLLGMRVDASDPDTMVAEVSLYLDGALVGTSTAGGAGAFAFLADVTAGSHTAYAIAKDQAGNQATSANVGFTAASCATAGCDDSDTCTTDRCASTGACVHSPAPGCCTGNPDCDDGDACTTDACAGGTCAHAALAGCCNSGFDCADADACTTDLCSGLGGTCAHAPAGCCSGAGDCNDANACTTDSCVRVPSTATNGWCAHDWSAGCCGVNADCDDADACTTDTCSGGTCSHAAIAGCCRDSTACQDGDACTSDLCADHVCTYTPITGCCATSADCTTLNPCSTGTCNKGYCSFTATAGCCNFDFECQDADPCTVHACQAHACALVSATAGCADAGVAPPDAAAPGPDAAAAGPDAAAPGLDAAAPGLDAAAPGLDAATAGLDASTPVLDAGQPADAAAPGTDATAIAPDAAQPPADAAAPAGDAGPLPADASAEEPDAETAADAQPTVQEDAAAVSAADAANPSADAGAVVADAAAAQQADAGMGEVVTSGCGCGTGAGPFPLLALAIVALGAVRRRRAFGPEGSEAPRRSRDGG